MENKFKPGDMLVNFKPISRQDDEVLLTIMEYVDTNLCLCTIYFNYKSKLTKPQIIQLDDSFIENFFIHIPEIEKILYAPKQ